MDFDLSFCLRTILSNDTWYQNVLIGHFAKNKYELLKLSDQDYEQMKTFDQYYRVGSTYASHCVTAGAINRLKEFVNDVVRRNYWDGPKEQIIDWYAKNERTKYLKMYEPKIIEIIDKRIGYVVAECQCVVPQQ